MNIEDIFIGARVYVTDLPTAGKKTAVKVVDINASKDCINCEYEGITVWVWIGRVEPIPLTGKILKSNGFGYTENDTLFELHHYYLGEPQFCRDMDLHIGNKKDVFWVDYNVNHIGGILYVHELQLALRICGVDKQIKL